MRDFLTSAANSISSMSNKVLNPNQPQKPPTTNAYNPVAFNQQAYNYQQPNLHAVYQSQLKQRLAGCIYAENNKMYIMNAVMRLGGHYNNLQVGTICLNFSGKQGQYIELSGNVPVNYKGASYPVFIKLMFPEYYPNQPPMIRVINIDPQKYTVIEEWKSLQSPADQTSYPLNFLNSIKNWTINSDASMVIMEAQQIMAMKFPFRTKHSSSHMTSSVPAFSSSPGNLTNTNHPTHMTSTSNPTKPTTPMVPVKPSTPPVAEQPRILNFPAKGSTATQIKKLFGNCQANVSKLQENADKQVQTLRKAYTSTFQSIQKIDQINKCIEEETKILKDDNKQLETYLHEADRLVEVDLTSVVVPADEMSGYMVDLLAQKRAIEAIIVILESRFKQGEINFETFMKLIRKYQQEKFEAKVILRKVANRM